jgi:hypothetical protein
MTHLYRLGVKEKKTHTEKKYCGLLSITWAGLRDVENTFRTAHSLHYTHRLLMMTAVQAQ